MRTYEYQGEKFEVSKPEDCRVEVHGKGETGLIRLDGATRKFYVKVLGRTTSHASFEEALKRLCAAVLAKEARPPLDDLCKEMDAFYDRLS